MVARHERRTGYSLLIGVRPRATCPLTSDLGAPPCRPMRAVQVSRPGGPLELVERPVPDPGPGLRADQGAGLRHLPQRRADQGGPLARDRVPAGAGARGDRRDRRRGPGRSRRGGSPASGSASAGTPGTVGYCDTCRRGDFFACQTGMQVTGISFDGGYADYMIAPATALAVVPGRAGRHGRRPADVRRRHHLQRAAQQRGPAGRPGRRPRRRRARPPRRPVRGQDGLPHGGHRPRDRTRSRSPGNSARPTTSTARPPTRPPSWRSSAGPRSSSPRSPTARR